MRFDNCNYLHLQLATACLMFIGPESLTLRKYVFFCEHVREWVRQAGLFGCWGGLDLEDAFVCSERQDEVSQPLRSMFRRRGFLSTPRVPRKNSCKNQQQTKRTVFIFIIIPSVRGSQFIWRRITSSLGRSHIFHFHSTNSMLCSDFVLMKMHNYQDTRRDILYTVMRCVVESF